MAQREFKHLLICWAKTESLCQLYPHEKNGTMKTRFNHLGQISMNEKTMPRRLKAFNKTNGQ